MASSVPLSVQIEWYRIRDMLFGQNRICGTVSYALRLAASCEHPDARWLTRVFEGKSACSREEARRVLEAENDARGLSFAWMLLGFDGQNDLTMLRRAAELGSPLALAFLADRRETTSADRFKFALQAAAQGERHGFYLLGCCFHDGRACIPDAKKEEENLTIASELGHVWAMCELGNLLRGRPRWLWWGRAAACGECYYMLANFSKEVEAFERGNGKPDIVFAIGRALHGHVDVKARRIFTSSFDFPVCIGPAQQAVAFYEAQIQATKDAMCAWTLVGIHFNVVKDVRKLIAKLIWDAREEALFKPKMNYENLILQKGRGSMKSPMTAASAGREDAEGLLLARVQLREEGSACSQELRAALASKALADVPVEDTLARVPVLLVEEGEEGGATLPAHWHRRPTAILMIGCGDLDEFKEKHLRTALKWIEDAETRQLDWLVVISEGQRGRGRSVFEKMKSEAGSKREDQVLLLEAGMPALLTQLRKAVGTGLTRALREFREHIRGLETRRGTEGWNCAGYIWAQEGLAAVLERAQHWKAALAALETAEAVLREERNSVGFSCIWSPKDAGLLSAASPAGREALRRSAVSAFQAHSYLSGRVLQMLHRHDLPENVMRRAAASIKNQRRLALESGADAQFVRRWSAAAWRECGALLAEPWRLLALRSAASIDGDWSAVAAAGARRAQTEGRFWGGYPSSAGIDEGWTLIRKAALEAEAKRGGLREAFALWLVAPSAELLAKCQSLKKEGALDEWFDSPQLAQDPNLRVEPVPGNDDELRVWLAPDLSVRVPRAAKKEASAKVPDEGSGKEELTAVSHDKEKEELTSSSQSVRWEAHGTSISDTVEQVRVCSDETELVLAVDNVPGSAVLRPEGTKFVSVTTSQHGTVSVPVVSDKPSDSQHIAFLSSELDCDDLHVGQWTQLTVRARLLQPAVVATDGGDDWTVVGRIVASLSAGEHELCLLASPRRAGVVLLPRTRLHQQPGAACAWTGTKAVRVAPPLSFVCATRPERRDDADDDDTEVTKGAPQAASPDPKMLRYSAPP